MIVKTNDGAFFRVEPADGIDREGGCGTPGMFARSST
jgi:hypothetical protein